MGGTATIVFSVFGKFVPRDRSSDLSSEFGPDTDAADKPKTCKLKAPKNSFFQEPNLFPRNFPRLKSDTVANTVRNKKILA